MGKVLWQLQRLTLSPLLCLGCSHSPQPGNDVSQAAKLAAEWQSPAGSMLDNLFPGEVSSFKGVCA